MINIVATENRRFRKGPIWWITAIITPIGVFSGPIALAQLFAGIIRWQGWIRYLIAFWHENIGAPFHQVLWYLATSIHVPRPPEWLSDYLILGILFVSSLIRADALVFGPSREFRGWSTAFITGLAAVLFVLFIYLPFWPLVIAAMLRRIARDADFRSGEQLALIALTLAPFLIFLGLLVTNMTLG
jgi:hypothetical protein